MNLQSVTGNKWARRGAWAVVVLLVLWVVTWLAVPPLVKSELQKIASRELGRKVTVGAVAFKPWSLELTLTDLAVATADGAGQQFHLKRLYLNADIQSLLRLAPVLDAVALDAPSLKLARVADGHYDIDDILARLNQPAGKKAPGKPLRFAVYNVTLQGGSVDFDDKVVGKVQQLRDLTIAVPFLSDLDSKRDVVVRPRLAFTLNGSHFDSAAEGTPFAQTHKTDATFKLAGFDVTPYLGYIPAELPVRLKTGVIDADLRLAFEQTTAPSVTLSGTVRASHVRVDDAKANELLAFDGLDVALTDLRPFARVVDVASIALTNPKLSARRDANGHINLDLGARAARAGSSTPPEDPAQGTTEGATKGAEASPPAAGASSPHPAPAPAESADAWKIAIAKLSVRGGTLLWTDDSTVPHAQAALHDLEFDAASIALPFEKPLQFSGSATLDAAAAGAGKAPAAATLTFGGSATDRAASVAVNARAIPLAVAGPYLAAYLQPRIEGALSTQVNLDWKAAAAKEAADPPAAARPAAALGTLHVGVRTLTLDDVALVEPQPARPARQTRQTKPGSRAKEAGTPDAAHAEALPSVKRIEVSDARIDLARQTVSVDRLSVTDPHAGVLRGADKQWMFQRWLKTGASPAAARDSERNHQNAKASPWQVAIKDIAIDGGEVAYRDEATARPVAFQVSALKVDLKNFATDGNQPFPLVVSARVGAGRIEPGRLDYHGDVGLAPLSAQGEVQAVRLPLQAFAPYLNDRLNVELVRADGSFHGRVQYRDEKAGPFVKVAGDAALEDLRANSLPDAAGGTTDAAPTASAAASSGVSRAPRGDAAGPAGASLLRWKALGVRGLSVAMQPGAPIHVDIRETALTDFFARVIINPDGRINLQNLVKPSPQAAAAPAASGAAGAAPTARAEPAPVINVGPISLINGKVSFTDHFIKPNYSADLSELTGRLGAFSSVAPAGAPQMADLELRGHAEGTAALEITGKLNPLAKPLALDITGKMSDLDLPPLSPYSVKYSGHEIERGKMSMNVHYVIQPDGRLTAQNQLVLNQLSFGDEVAGAKKSLPVKLAVALLADSDGVINLDLPISGSLNDPQFSLGGIIVKAIFNLIAKAITAPFSLLAHAFGGSGGEQLSTVAFAPGSATLSAEARAGLDKVAKALIAKPKLDLTVVGTADLDAEREGYRRERLNAMVRAEKRREMVLSGPVSAAAAPATPVSAAGSSAAAAAGGAPRITVSEAEYPALLKKVYQRSDIPRPRNLLGFAKDIPQSEMESLLMASIPVTDDAIRQLALARSAAVRDYLASREVPAERLFLGAPKLGAAGAEADAKWAPHANLSLAMK